MEKFVQGKPADTEIEKYIQANLAQLEEQTASFSEAKVNRIRNVFTFGKMKEIFLRNNFKSYDLRLVESDYYDKTLEERSKILRAPVNTLCKSMIMENTAYQPEYEG